MIRCSVERTEFAPDPTDVRIVQDATDDVCRRVARYSLLASMICQSRQLKHVGVFEQELGFVRADSLVSIDLFGNRIDRDSKRMLSS